MATTSLRPVDRYATADTTVVFLLGKVRERVEDGDDLAVAFADEFIASHAFLRAAALFTNALPVVTPCRLEEMPRRVVLDALDVAIASAAEVRPRNFKITGGGLR